MVRLTKHWVLTLPGGEIAAKNFDLNPLKVDFAEDDNAAGYFDRNAGRALGRYGEVSFTTEAKSTGAGALVLGTPISQADLFKAAGFEEALGAGISSIYALTDNPQADRVLCATLDWYFGAPAGTAALKHSITNVAFDLTIRGMGNSICEFDWKGLGVFSANPAEATATFTESASDPIRVLAAAITGMFASPLVVREFEISLNNDVVLPIDAAAAFGRGDPIITARDVTYRIQVQEPDVADADFWENLQSGATTCGNAIRNRFTATLGDAGCSGSLLTINGVFRMSGIPERVEADGISYYNIVGKQSPNDEYLTLTFL